MKIGYTDFSRVTGRPVFEEFGLRNVPMLYGKFFFKAKENDGRASKTLHADLGKRLVERLGANYNGVLIADWEHIGIHMGFSDALVRENSLVIHKAIDEIRDALPNVTLGIYAAAAVGNLHIGNARNGAYLAERMRHYTKWLKPILDRLDMVLAGGGYTLNDREDEWRLVLNANVSAAMELADGKPLVVYTKPRFRGNDPIFANDWIPYAQWRAQLEHLGTILGDDGEVVIWEGRVGAWDKQDDIHWWRATKELVKTNPSNNAPVITTIPPVEAVVGEEYIYPMAGVDRDSDALTYMLGDAPPRMKINLKVGDIRWTPIWDDMDKIYKVDASVTDGKLSDIQRWSIAVSSRCEADLVAARMEIERLENEIAETAETAETRAKEE